MMGALRVKFVDFPGDDMRNITLPILKKNFGHVEESENPDFVFYSVFGYEHMKYDCVRIFWTGENLQPDFNICDYAIGFGYLDFEDRYRRIPLYYFYALDYERAINKHKISEQEINLREKKFCNFIYSNEDARPEREQFFHLLNQYRQVDSGGKILNNIGGGTIKNKFEFQKKYKFSIAFENSSTSGYTTEKILQAFAAGTIPIYWGNPHIERDFNQKAFINCHAFDSFERVIEKVKEIDQNDELYREYLRQPIGDGSLFPMNPLTEYEKYLVYICSQNPAEAIRRSNTFWGRKYQEELKSIRLPQKRNWLVQKTCRIMERIKLK
ncbi:MAG: glycosyltransferase family 10 [Clostridium sp.]|nr:glycosyltransferase family 10 [Clostridium sp.]MCM1540502.1 glycosyltransferase family 10 [Blautia sp.]